MSSIGSPIKALARGAGIRRSRIAGFKTRYERNVLATTSRRSPAGTGRILCYHSVGTPLWGINDVSPARFRDQIEFALRLGYRFVPAASVAHGNASANDLAITFDDGLMSVVTHAAPILADKGIPWTMFIVSGWADGRHPFGDGVVMGWAEVESLALAGVEIGSHSVSHPDFGLIPAGLALAELVESKRQIEERTGLHTAAFAIPLGQSKNWTAGAGAAAEEAGYELVYAQSVRCRPAATIPRTFITGVDDHRLFKAAIEGAFDEWEEWL